MGYVRGMRRIWLVWVAVLAACVAPASASPDVVAGDGAGEAAVGIDTGPACVACSDARCRGCSGGCCLVFEDAAADGPAADGCSVSNCPVVGSTCDPDGVCRTLDASACHRGCPHFGYACGPDDMCRPLDGSAGDDAASDGR